MKYILMLFFTAMSFLSTNAQQKPNMKVIFSTPGVHCEYCKKRLENYVSTQYGVISVNADFKKKTTTVEWIKD